MLTSTSHTLFRACRRRLSSQAHSSPLNPANRRLIDVLVQHMEAENASPERNAFKVKAYQTAIESINQFATPITHLHDLKAVKGIGPKILYRLEPHLSRDNTDLPNDMIVSKQRYVHSPEERLKIRQQRELRSIPGVGCTVAERLWHRGCRSLSDLEQNPKYLEILSPTQQASFRHMRDLSQPVTPTQCELAKELVAKSIGEDFESILVGSYRRGARDTEAVDILLLHPDYSEPLAPTSPPPTIRVWDTGKRIGRNSIPFRNSPIPLRTPASNLLKKRAVQSLTDEGVAVETLSLTSSKWTGIMALSAAEGTNFRRLNLSLAPIKSRGAAILALTGDTEFIHHLHTQANRVGLHLTEFGLWRWKGDHEPSELICSESEEDIFHHLGMDFVEPTRRNLAHIKPSSRKSH